MFFKKFFCFLGISLCLLGGTSIVHAQTPASSDIAPQITDCEGFGNYLYQFEYLQTYSLADAANDLEGYFHTDLRQASDQIMENLIAQSESCMKSIDQKQEHLPSLVTPSNEQEVGREATELGDARIAIRDMGIGFLQMIQEANDAPAQAAAAAQRTQQNKEVIESIPQCGDPNIINSLKNDVTNSPAGKNEGLALLAMKDFVDVSDPPHDNYRTCQADALFNNGENTVTYKIKWFDQSHGQMSISMQLPQ